MQRSWKIKIGGIVVLLLILMVGMYFNNQQQKQQQQESYQFPAPEVVVRQYFQAWNDQNYVDMYATLSDGFKRIEPQAKDFTTFIKFAEGQDITGINIISIDEKSNNGQTAQVDYAVEFLSGDGTRRPFSSTFTLKYRSGDIIQGWKLVHPYGETIDTS